MKLDEKTYFRLPEVTYLKYIFRVTDGDIRTLFLVLSGYTCPPTVEVPR